MILRFSNIRGQPGVSPQPFLASRECHGSLGIYPGAVLERFYTAVCSDKSVQLPHNQAKAKNGWIPITIYYNMDSHHYGSLCSFGFSYKDPELTKDDKSWWIQLTNIRMWPTRLGPWKIALSSTKHSANKGRQMPSTRTPPDSERLSCHACHGWIPSGNLT